MFPPGSVPSDNETGGTLQAFDLTTLHADDEGKSSLAALLQDGAKLLADNSVEAIDLLEFFETELRLVRAKIRVEGEGECLLWASDQFATTLEMVTARFEHRKETGSTFTGLSTGFPDLDDRLNGLHGGRFYALAGGPGVGKTTTALAIARSAAKTAPVVYLTYENPPANLVLKCLCAVGDVSTLDTERGFISPDKLLPATEQWAEAGSRLAFLNGTSGLTISRLESYAREAMERHESEQCLVIVDYLQLAAKSSRQLEGDSRQRVETMSGQLLEMAKALNSPVIGICSQKRKQGSSAGYSNHNELDSLKESGDLEYSSDVVLILANQADGNGKLFLGDTRPLSLHIVKNRHGDTGQINLTFFPMTGRVIQSSQLDHCHKPEPF